MALNTYSDFQAESVSEKIGLVQLEATRRLMGWVLSAGSVYRLTGFDYAAVIAIEDSGVAYASAASQGAVTAGTYFHDRANKTLYLQASDSSNPNSRFLVLTFRLFFANVPVAAPVDLGTGPEVEWLPLLKDASQLAQELDNQNQLGMAIEGTGTISFSNDHTFWDPLFDSVYFENQRVFVYSWNRNLPYTEAKLIYRGRIRKKKFNADTVSFDLKDFMNEIRSPVPLPLMSAVAGARIPDSLKVAFQRRLYGYVRGHRPTNIDQELGGYPLTGTVAVAAAGSVLTGAGTSFLAQLSDGDQVFCGGDSFSVAIKSVDSDTQVTLTQPYSGQAQSGVAATVRSSHPKRYMNRKWIVAGHPLKEPATTLTLMSTLSLLQVASAAGFMDGDDVLVNGTLATMARARGSYLALSTSLPAYISPGAPVVRPSITNAFIDRDKLILSRDFTYDAATATVTLDPLAEFNVAATKSLSGTLTFTSGNRVVTGSGTAFKTQLSKYSWICAVGQATFYEVLSIDSDTQVTLRAAPAYSASGVSSVYRTPNVYKEGATVFCCDALGVTDDGTKTGTLLKTAGAIVKDLLTQVGLSSMLNAQAFSDADAVAYPRLGLAIPSKFNDTQSPAVRDVINQVGQSVFGSLVQNADFQLEYHVLSPAKPASMIKLRESDVLQFEVDCDSDRIVQAANVQYGGKEYDPTSSGPASYLATAVSKAGQYMAKTTNQMTQPTLLVDSVDAQTMANRWAFILSVASSVVTVDSKLQISRVAVGDKIQIEHEKLYQRIGSNSRKKIAAVQIAKKGMRSCTIEVEDLAGAFSRCATIAAIGSAAWANASDQDRASNGYVTDSWGMINNDPATFGVNLVW